MSTQSIGFEHDRIAMNQALALAQQAGLAGEIPIGAVVADPQGQVIGQGSNSVESKKSQAFHAEMIALNQAADVLGDWRLDGCTLYVTLQPCLMCCGMLALSRVERLVWAAGSPIYGVELDMLAVNPVYTKHTKFFSTGVMENEAQELLKRFFKKRRMDE